jgi:hypothetical protein
MTKLNVDPIATFPDGSHLLVSTQHSREGIFICELYVANGGIEERLDLRAVSNRLDAPTCLEAQEIAYNHAMRLYPGNADEMKKPPYLVWRGPVPHT